MKPAAATIAVTSAVALMAGGGGYGFYVLDQRLEALESKVARQEGQIADAHWLAGEAMDVAEAPRSDEPQAGKGASEDRSGGKASKASQAQGKAKARRKSRTLPREEPPAESRQGALQASDPILGPKQAPISVIVYTDLECPYCKQFHNTGLLQQLVEQAEGAINATYRATPLRSHGREAVKEAIAADCARRLAGDQAYWQTVETIFQATRGKGRGTGRDLGQLVARVSGADRKALRQCMGKREVAQSVLQSRQAAARSGVRQTPSFRVVDNRTGQSRLVNGNKPRQLMNVLGSMVEGSGISAGRPGRSRRR